MPVPVAVAVVAAVAVAVAVVVAVAVPVPVPVAVAVVAFGLDVRCSCGPPVVSGRAKNGARSGRGGRGAGRVVAAGLADRGRRRRVTDAARCDVTR